MNFLDKLDYLMEKMSINKSKLSQISGVPYTTINSFYKKGYENTKISTIRKIACALDVSVDYLVDDNIQDENYSPKTKTAPLYSSEAMDIARRYSGLDIYGKDTIRAVMETEENRVKEMAELDGPTTKQEPKIIPLFWSASAAGIASPILGEDFDNYELKEEDPQGAMFAVKVQGDSMEPYFPDGSIAFCNKDPLQDGDIGVFSVDGGSVIKQHHYDGFMGMTYLFSLNRNRSDADVVIPRSTGQTLVCQGRVITRRRYPLPR